MPNFTAYPVCHPDPVRSKEELFGEIRTLLSLMDSEDTMIHPTRNKMRNANFERKIPTAVLPGKFQRGQDAAENKMQRKWKKKTMRGIRC